MSLADSLQQLQESSLAWTISGNPVIFPWIESVHVLAITFVVGSIAMVDLRLLGWASRGDSLARMTREIVPWTIGAFGIAAVTGSLLFISNAVRYSNNGFFRAKLVLLALAGLNMLVFHFAIGRRVADWPASAPAPSAARVSGGLSLAFWVIIVVFGRWVGFTL
jgi:hypothetical protein